jgi:cytochrome c peroxidase
MVRNITFIIVVSFFLLSLAFSNTTLLEKKKEQLRKEKKLISYRPVVALSNKDSSMIELGKLLFHDKTLSRNNNLSCASCHIENKGFSNGESISEGTHGTKLKRHIPHLYNLELNTTYFWDGRAKTLEEQLAKVITSKEEMDMNFPEVISRLNQMDVYKEKFKKVFPKDGISKNTLTKSIVAYEKSIKAFDSSYDKYLDGNDEALTTIQKKGFELFITKANCIACHHSENLTDNLFHNVGVKTNDLGRHLIDKVGMNNEFESTPYPFFSMFKAFKTPSLRNVQLSAPYFHDGSKKTLKEVVEFYNKGGENADQTGLAKEIKPLGLDDNEIDALVEFLNAFTSSNTTNY